MEFRLRGWLPPALEICQERINGAGPKVIRETLSGYARTSEVTELERKERLRNMSAEESLAIYEGLVETWLAMRQSDQDDRRLDEWRLETTLAMRRALDALAKSTRTQ